MSMILLRFCLLKLLVVSLSACDGGFSATEATSFSSVPPDSSAGNTQGSTAPKAWPAFAWDEQHPDSATWNAITYNAILEHGPALITATPDDVQSFCPNYDSLQPQNKIFFWIGLIASMSRYESGFDPETSYQENFKDQQGEFIISRGLLQLSIESAKGYNCPVTQAQQLHDAETNLRCGVIILNRWLDRDGVVSHQSGSQWLGGARYWSVLRNETIKSNIIAATAKSEMCR